jgi:hypothetical protein
LETPIDRPGDDRRNVAKLWELAGLKDQAPAVEKGFSMLTPAVRRQVETQAARHSPRAKSVAAAFRSGRLSKPVNRTKKSAGRTKKSRRRG